MIKKTDDNDKSASQIIAQKTIRPQLKEGDFSIIAKIQVVEFKTPNRDQSVLSAMPSPNSPMEPSLEGAAMICGAIPPLFVPKKKRKISTQAKRKIVRHQD